MSKVDQKIINLYDEFTHGGMNRRQFLDRLTEIAGSSAAAVALLPILQNNYAQAAVVAPDDARLVSERAAFESPKGKIDGYLVRPKAKGKRPTIKKLKPKAVKSDDLYDQLMNSLSVKKGA